MVLSFNESPYKELMQAQNDTWASVGEFEVKTLFYYGGSGNSIHHEIIHQSHKSVSHELQLPCGDKYYYMAEKLKLALEYAKDWDYDIIFRTNSSSYVNKKRLKEFAATLPKEKLYAGWEIKTNEGFSIVSGAGFFLSRDTAEILRIAIDPTFEKEEDYYCGSIMNHYGIKVIDDKSRVDVNIVNYDTPLGSYHYRFKTADRINDSNNMRLLHQKVIKL